MVGRRKDDFPGLQPDGSFFGPEPGEVADEAPPPPPVGPSMFGDDPAPKAEPVEASDSKEAQAAVTPPPVPDVMAHPAKAAAKLASARLATATTTDTTESDDVPPTPPASQAAVAEVPPGAATTYKVIALKYRPQTFDDLVGQSHIKEALTNAIRQDKVAHAFLFSGSRGTGKTTSARIFAKALNCLSQRGPTPDPCGVCVACREIAESRDLDVLEIDGASNNGIEQIRELRGSIDNKPARDRFKVVIIDEVHMLSTAAFNALLKTLEEPPSHVKFIFATTDPHKVPETIHSRCQHYDFRRLSATEIAGCLREIAEKEGVTTDGGVFESIAAICEGGMRDAQSKLDQLIAFRGTHLTVADLEQVFGLVSREGLLRLIQSTRKRDVAAVFAFIEDAFSQGKDLGALVAALTRLYRDLMVIRACGGDFTGLDLLPSEKALLPDEARQWPQDALMLAVDLLSACGARLKTAEFPRFVLESSMLKLCDLGSLRPMEDLIAGIDAVLRGGVAGVALAGMGPSAAQPPRPYAAPAREAGPSLLPPRESAQRAEPRRDEPRREEPRREEPARDVRGPQGRREVESDGLERFAPPPAGASGGGAGARGPARPAKQLPPAMENAVRLVREVFPPEGGGR